MYFNLPFQGDQLCEALIPGYTKRKYKKLAKAEADALEKAQRQKRDSDLPETTPKKPRKVHTPEGEEDRKLSKAESGTGIQA